MLQHTLHSNLYVVHFVVGPLVRISSERVWEESPHYVYDWMRCGGIHTYPLISSSDIVEWDGTSKLDGSAKRQAGVVAARKHEKTIHDGDVENDLDIVLRSIAGVLLLID